MTCETNSTDLCWYRGDTQTIVVTYTDSAGGPVDITGYTAKSQIRAKPGDTDPALVEITEQDSITLDGPAGQLTLVFSSQNTGPDLDAQRKASWDLQITSPGGVVTTLVYGNIEFITDVTR